mgnify:CR=1 FL=1
MSERFTVEMHDTLPVMMTKFNPDFVFEEDAMAYTIAAKKCLDSQETPVFYVFDLTMWNVMSFDEIMRAAAQAARGKDSNFHHPMNRATLIVTVDKLVGKSAEGLTGAAYGNANIKVFQSVEAALAHVRANL